MCLFHSMSVLSYIIGGVGAEQDHATLLLQRLSSTPFVFSEFFRDTVCMWVRLTRFFLELFFYCTAPCKYSLVPNQQQNLFSSEFRSKLFQTKVVSDRKLDWSTLCLENKKFRNITLSAAPKPNLLVMSARQENIWISCRRLNFIPHA